MSESIRTITSSEYTLEKLQAEALIRDYCARVKKALGARQARKLKELLTQEITCDDINIIMKYDEWKGVLNAIAFAFCNNALHAQYNFSNKEFRKKLTPEVIKMKCESLGFEENGTELLIQLQLKRFADQSHTSL